MSRYQYSANGFVLVAVLWILAIMALAATAFSAWVDTVRESAASRQQEVQTQIRSIDILSKLIYSYSTSVRTTKGIVLPELGSVKGAEVKFDSLDDFMAGAAPKAVLAEGARLLPLDNTLYETSDEMVFMAQDRGGLIGLSFLTDIRVFTKLVRYFGSSENPHRLMDHLHDYQDPDDYRRINGAERLEYAQKGLPHPRNQYLRSPLELRNVMLWNSLWTVLDDAAVLRMFKEAGTSTVNVNTAPKGVLSLVFNQGDVEAIERRRVNGALSNVGELSVLAADDGSIPLSVLPSEGVRIWIWHQGDSTANIYDVQFSDLKSGKDSWYFHWTTRAALPNDMVESDTLALNHAFFQ